MKNNKLTRKRAEKLAAKQEFVKQLDGTEVLKTKESRAKKRRWSFEADIEIVFPAPKNKDGSPKLGEDGEPIKAPMGMKRTMRLEPVSYSTAKEAIDDCKRHEMYLREANALFAKSNITVRAIPHETVSNETIRQLTGYRDMAMILDKALDMAIREAGEVVAGKAIGSQFVEMPAVPGMPAVGDAPAVADVPAKTVAIIKEEFYKRALDELKPKELTNVQGSKGEEAVTLTDSEEGERKPFIPEIVEVQRTSEVNPGATDGAVV